MKLLAPVSNLESAILQIESGATEIYLGGDTDCFNNFTFTGRGKYNINNKKVSIDNKELRQIVEYAHAYNVTVMYTANIPFLADDVTETHKYLNAFVEYVQEAINIGVDTVVVADLTAILLLKERGINTHITASVFLETINKEQILFLQDLGFDRIVLSYHVTLEEIKQLVNSTSLEIEVFGHYGCSFYDGYCNLKHSFGESKENCLGIPCQNKYQLQKEGEIFQEGNILNASLVCSVCSLIELEKMGVYALKLVGRSRDIKQNAEITHIYAQLIKFIDQNKNKNELDMIKNFEQYRKEILPRWWIQGLCKAKSCKYQNNAVTQAYIGAKSGGNI